MTYYTKGDSKDVFPKPTLRTPKAKLLGETFWDYFGHRNCLSYDKVMFVPNLNKNLRPGSTMGIREAQFFDGHLLIQLIFNT